MFRVWLPTLYALLSVCWAANEGIAPCYVQPACQSDRVVDRPGSHIHLVFDVFLGAKGFHDHELLCGKFARAKRIDSFDCSRHAPDHRSGYRNSERPGQHAEEMASAQLAAAPSGIVLNPELTVAMWADQHAPMVAQQHSPRNETAGCGAKRKTSCR